MTLTLSPDTNDLARRLIRQQVRGAGFVLLSGSSSISLPEILLTPPRCCVPYHANCRRALPFRVRRLCESVRKPRHFSPARGNTDGGIRPISSGRARTIAARQYLVQRLSARLLRASRIF